MHWMQRIRRPTARKQCIDEGYRLHSRDIAYRHGAFDTAEVQKRQFVLSPIAVEFGP
jgi:hypothetical protein